MVPIPAHPPEFHVDLSLSIERPGALCKRPFLDRYPPGPLPPHPAEHELADRPALPRRQLPLALIVWQGGGVADVAERDRAGRFGGGGDVVRMADLLGVEAGHLVHVKAE